MVNAAGKRPRQALVHLVSIHRDRLSAPTRTKYRTDICQFVVDEIRHENPKFWQKVVEAKLAERFGVVIIKVRESIQRLVSEGWVERIQNRGVVVRSFDLASLRVFLSARCLKGKRLELSPKWGPPIRSRNLRQLIDEALKCGDFESSREADAHFHRLLVRLSRF